MAHRFDVPFFCSFEAKSKKMNIQNLSTTPLTEIVACFVEAFKDYVVKMPSDVEYWRKRFRGARADFEMSFAMFDNHKMVGFMIIGMDTVDGKKIAFNTGTGVIEAYRGQKIVDKLYQHALPIYENEGIEIASLEVIQGNDRAIRVYERCGFKIEKSLRCFKGDLTVENNDVEIQKTTMAEIFKINAPFQANYSWDFVNSGIILNEASYHSYFINSNNETIGYFIINPDTGMLAQFECLNGNSDWNKIMMGIAKVCNTVKMNNVNNERTALVQTLIETGLDNFIDQYEMNRLV